MSVMAADPAVGATARWRQRRSTRTVVAAVVTVSLLGWMIASVGFVDDGRATGGQAFLLLPALVLWAFLRRVSYRRRDIAILLLVPVYGQFLCGVIVSRLLALPRRDWTPRPDELPRVVRIPQGRGAYVLAPSFAQAEELRGVWCRNVRHAHPYESAAVAPLIGCQPTSDSAD